MLLWRFSIVSRISAGSDPLCAFLIIVWRGGADSPEPRPSTTARQRGIKMTSTANPHTRRTGPSFQSKSQATNPWVHRVHK
ncbi:hypothetical protein BGW80DRAFT_1298504 [Lactifluus volemus]|nr:hypothetical protein BGW80DRAFT_1298504 [Lactifluus volemus]